MNYQDKAWVHYAGRPMLEHVIDHIEQDVAQILISRNRPNPAYNRLPYLSVPDELPGYQGPLAGLASCTNYIENDKVLVLPCDVPILPQSLVTRLMTGLIDFDIAVASSGGAIQPLVFMAKTQVLKSISTFLESGERSVKKWLALGQFAEIEFGAETFENINEASQLR